MESVLTCGWNLEKHEPHYLRYGCNDPKIWFLTIKMGYLARESPDKSDSDPDGSI